VATRDVFSEDELAQLRGFPELARAELIRYFTLAPADEAFVRKFRGQDNVMGVAVQLGTLPWLGFVPDDVAAAPAAVVARLSEKLDIPAGALRLRCPRADPHRSPARGRRVPGLADGRRAAVEGPGGVLVRAGDGARLAEAAVPAGL